MPRLTNDRYYQCHQLLRQLWLKHEGRFGLLMPSQQWDVHDYYRPSEEIDQLELISTVERSVLSGRPYSIEPVRPSRS
jgi:hypothetical protein